jgi:type IV fimbrial biogenesis protein FimT
MKAANLLPDFRAPMRGATLRTSIGVPSRIALKPGRRKLAGFTIPELMLTIAVAGVLAAIAIPSMRDFNRNARLTSAVNDLLRSTQTARSEAITRQSNVVVCASDDPLASEPACADEGNFTGWIVFQDTNSNWTFDGDDEDTPAEDGEPVIQRYAPVPASVSVRADNDGIFSYSPTGFATPAGANTPSTRVVFCDERGDKRIGTESTARALIVEATGRARVTKLGAEVGSALGVTGNCP